MTTEMTTDFRGLPWPRSSPHRWSYPTAELCISSQPSRGRLRVWISDVRHARRVAAGRLLYRV